MAKTRIVYLDVAKVLCAFLVVFAHLYSKESMVRVFIYSFHMPFFFLVSGLFHRDLSIRKSITTNFRRIIIPTVFYLICFVFFDLIYVCCIGNTQEVTNSLKYNITWIFRGFIYGQESRMPNGYVWFLIVLFYCKIAQDLFNKNKFFMILYFVLFITLLFFKYTYLYLGQAVMSIPFYFIGKTFNNPILNLSKSSIKWKLIRMIVCLTIMIIIPLFNGKVSIVAISFGSFIFPFNLLAFYCCALMGSLFALDLSSFVKKVNKIINNISMSLISIVGFQFIFIKLYDTYIGKDQNIFISMIVCSIIVLLCYISHKIFIRIFPWIFNK